MRAFLLLAALTACEGQDVAALPAQSLHIPCTPDGGDPARCGLTRASIEGSTVLTVTEPDGGFRRFAVSREGAIATADGAVPARVASARDGMLEVSVDDDRYRLPAR